MTTKTMQSRDIQRERAEALLLHKEHVLTTRTGILEWMEAVALGLTHDLPEMSRQKATTATYTGSVLLKALRA